MRLSSSLNIILIINESPWGNSLSATAARLAGHVSDSGHNLQAVFFREDGVYNCQRGMSETSSTENPAGAWADLGANHDTHLMVCQSSAARRLPQKPESPFREAGLVELMDRVADCDRVITL